MTHHQIILGESITSDKTNSIGKQCDFGDFLSEAAGWKIIEATAKWKGTPYGMVGSGSVKGVIGDCSGITNKSYIDAGFPYPYQSTANFANYARLSNRFRKIDLTHIALQVGDILLWPGHMAIYAPFPEGHPDRDTNVILRGKPQMNDMYTAFNTHTGVPYSPYNIATFRSDPYTAYRHLLLK
ncbi:MAG: hypothetical protein ABIT83_11610, partial [Massilia sp.]